MGKDAVVALGFSPDSRSAPTLLALAPFLPHKIEGRKAERRGRLLRNLRTGGEVWLMYG